MDAGFHQQALAAALDAQQDQALAAPGPVGLLVRGGEVRLAVCPVLQVGDLPCKALQIELPAAQRTFLEPAARLPLVQQPAGSRGVAVMRPELDVGAKESGADQRGLHRIPFTLIFRHDELELPALSVGNPVRQCLLDGPPLLTRADQDSKRAVISVETGPCGQRKARLLVGPCRQAGGRG